MRRMRDIRPFFADSTLRALCPCPVLSLVARALGSPPMQGDLGGLFLAAKIQPRHCGFHNLSQLFSINFYLTTKTRNFTKKLPCDDYISALTWINKSPALHSVIPLLVFFRAFRGYSGFGVLPPNFCSFRHFCGNLNPSFGDTCFRVLSWISWLK